MYMAGPRPADGVSNKRGPSEAEAKAPRADGRSKRHDHGEDARHDHDHHDHAHHDHHDHAHHDHDHAHHERDREHDHHGHGHGIAELRHTPLRRLVMAFGLTAGFMLVEAIMGFWSGSLALLADAGHMLADAAALGIAMIAQRIAAQERTRTRTYGFRRAEVLAAFANGVALALTAVWIFGEAVQRFREPQSVEAGMMTATAAAGLVVNLVAAALLSAGSHGHNVNTRAALAHVLSDALGSVGAILGGVLILTLGWTRADPAISAVIAVLILWGGFRLVRDTSHVLMEGSPIEIDIAHVEETILRVPGVVGFHDLHVWSISEGFDVLTVHVVIAPGHHGIDVVQAVSRRLREVHGLEHTTIQPEPAQRDGLVPLRRKPDEPARTG
jgi:cobalt-zinc-cadmium efflux system protein